MKSVNIHEAKTHLSRLVDEAARGKPFIIAKNGKAKVKVVPANEDEGDFVASRFDFLAGQFQVPDDFNRMFEDEIADMFEGKE